MNDKHRNLYEDPLSVLVWWYDIAIFAMMFASNSVIVFLRRNMGYRLLRPWILWVTGFALCLCAWMSATASSAAQNSFSGFDSTPPQPTPNPIAAAAPVYLFVAVMGILAFIHRRNGWNLAFRPGDPMHTMARGDSHLAKILPLHEWIIQRYIEPMLVFLVSFLCFALHQSILGWWLVIAGVSLAGIEELIKEKIINNFLDVRDSRVEAEVMQMMDSLPNAAVQAPQTKVGGLVVSSPELARLRADRLKNLPSTPSGGPSALGSATA